MLSRRSTLHLPPKPPTASPAAVTDADPPGQVSGRGKPPAGCVAPRPGMATDACGLDWCEGEEDSVSGVPPDGTTARDNPNRDHGGHFVMDVAAIVDAVAASGFDGGSDDLSSGEEQRVRALRRLPARSLFRRHLIGDAAMLERVAALDIASPNFAAVTRLVRNAVHLSHVGGAPIRLPPILMVGEAGIGKSRYARTLAAALGTIVEEVNGATIPGVGALNGLSPEWRAAGMGRIAKALIASHTSAPMVFIDECEKVVDYARETSPLDVLLPVLEPHTAAHYADEYLRVPLRADRIIWLLACNSLDTLSAPFLDRVVVVPVPGLGPTGRETILAGMLDEASRAAGVPVQLADPGAVAGLRDLGLRRVRQAMEIAIARAVAAGRRFVTREDLRAAADLLTQGATRQPFGFVHRSGRDTE